MYSDLPTWGLPRVRFLPGVILALAVVPAWAQEPGFCTTSAVSAGAPARDIYCLDLIPRPDMLDAAGVVELRRAPSPFDVAVSAQGRLRNLLVMTLSGLPEPGSLGPYTAYVAWIAPLTLEPMRKLGEVRNGQTSLGETDLDKFIVMISAEASPSVTERRGRLVLRGNSPSSRLQRHDLLMLPPGSGHAMPDPAWPMPPVDSTIPMFMPGVEALAPPEQPLLPGRGRDVMSMPAARPREIVDLEDGDTLRLTAGFVRRTIAGRPLVMYGFNGQYPGPLLRARQGATVTIEFINAIDQPSAVHWHGLRLDNRFDGAVGVTQDPVPPGGRFTYRVHFPDAGIYWYHSHYREDVQQDLGLYGNLFVPWTGEAAASSSVNREQFVMLDDLLLSDAGLFPFGTNDAIHALMGRFGNALLVNGEPRYSLTVGRGEVVRFYFTNASNTRTFNLSFAGARMKLVGADAGVLERESWVESVPIAPAQRYVVDVRFAEAGNYAMLNRVEALNHSFGYFFPQVDTLGSVIATSRAISVDRGARFGQLRPGFPEAGRYETYRVALPSRQLVLTLKTQDLPLALEQILQLETSYFTPVEWSGTMPMMDWLTTGKQAHWILRDPATGRENEAIDWKFRRGDLVKVRLVNDRATLHAMAHPIHLHGQRFLVLSQNGVPNDNLVWKDTVLLPVGSAADILVEMSNPGRWMMHCHIAEHLQAGMMAVFEVQ